MPAQAAEDVEALKSQIEALRIANAALRRSHKQALVGSAGAEDNAGSERSAIKAALRRRLPPSTKVGCCKARKLSSFLIFLREWGGLLRF